MITAIIWLLAVGLWTGFAFSERPENFRIGWIPFACFMPTAILATIVVNR